MDKDIIRRIKMGDQQAFELLYRKYFKRLCAFTNKFLHDYEVTQEIVQDIFFNIWKNRSQLKTDKTISSFLFQSAKNKSINALKHAEVKNKYKKLIKYTYLQGDSFDAENSLVSQELEAKIGEIIESLPEQCKRVFLMSRQEGKKYKEIAEELKISEKTVEAHISKALKIFRIELKEYLSIIVLILLENFRKF